MVETTILREDFEWLVQKSLIEWEKFAQSTILVTGATGLVGSYFIRALSYVSQQRNLSIRLLALVRNEKKAKAIYGDLLDDSKIELIVSDVTDEQLQTYLEGYTIDFIVHGASVTTSKLLIEQPLFSMNVSLKGTQNMLEIARKNKVQSFLYLSSMEVYGSFEAQETVTVTEEMQGYVDPLSVRSNYPLSKRLCENMCVAYTKEYGVHTTIARLAQTFGAGILQEENRVFAQFARSVIFQQDIVLHTTGQSQGNYCYLRDTVVALLLLLLKGETATAYNVSNEESHTSIYDMAQMICQEIADSHISVVLDIPQTNSHGYAKESYIKLDTKKIRNLGFEPKIGLKEAYQRMIADMKENYNLLVQ